MSVIMEAPFLLLLTGGLIFTLRTKSFPEDSRDLLLTLFFPNRKRFFRGGEGVRFLFYLKHWLGFTFQFGSWPGSSLGRVVGVNKERLRSA